MLSYRNVRNIGQWQPALSRVDAKVQAVLPLTWVLMSSDT